MGTVDFDDDDIRRFVVRRYAYDPERRERRHCVVAVVDNRREFERLFDVLDDELQRRREAGEEVDPREHLSGIVMEPGYLQRQRNAHFLKRALKHGVWSPAFAELDLPSSVGLFRTAKD